MKADFDVTGKKVCVIGNGPTSIQLVESFAEKATQLTQLMRTPREIHRKLTHADACNFLDAANIDKDDDVAIHKHFDTVFHECVFTGYSRENI